MKKKWFDLLTIAMTILAFAAMAMFIRRQFFSASGRTGRVALQIDKIENWKDYARNGSRIGSPTAPVQIVEFADFQCPFCAQFSDSYEYILKKYPSQTALVYRHYPMMSIHPYSVESARAAVCADRQHMFEPVHDFLYSHQDSIGKLSWVEIGNRAGLDVVDFTTCLENGDLTLELSRDSAAAADLGVRGTPTILVNSYRVAGNPGTSILDSLVQLALYPPK